MKKIAVIGGGNTAVDVARCAVRLGARAILVYRRRRQDMPAFAEEIAMAVAEGVELLELMMPVRIDVEGAQETIALPGRRFPAAVKLLAQRGIGGVHHHRVAALGILDRNQTHGR